ncbi:MAG: hypothetical protein R6V58_09255 [Planctomycetota bacterium]
MKKSISHDRADETPEAKARWFQSLTMSERLETFCEFYELAVALNPRLREKRRAQQPEGRVRVLELP